MINCTTCGNPHPKEHYPQDIRYSSGVRARCKKCNSIQSMESYRKKVYGLEKEQYKEFLKKHKNKCDVCGGSNRLHVDHDHKTGKNRGLLCGNCNTALGLLQDDESILVKLTEYLRASLTYT